MAASRVGASSGYGRATFDPSEEDLEAATDEMLNDPALHEIIRANVRIVMSELFGDAFKRITDIQHYLFKRVERLEMLIESLQNDGMPVHHSCERKQRMEVTRQMETPCGHFACSQCTCHRPRASQGSSASARHTDPETVNPYDASSSGPHSYLACQMPRDVPPPVHGMPHRESSPRSSPRSSLYRTAGSTPRRSSSAQPSMLAGGHHSDNTTFLSPVPRSVGPSELPVTMHGIGDGETRQILGEAHLTRSMSYEDMRQAPQQQTHHHHSRRRRSQSDTGGRLSVIPENPTLPGRQGRHSSPYVVEDGDHDDEARRSELPTPKEKGTGRVQQLMGKHSWWSLRKTN